MSCVWTGLPAALDHLGQCRGGLRLTPRYSHLCTHLGTRLGSAHHAGPLGRGCGHLRTHLGTRLGSAHHHHTLPISIDHLGQCGGGLLLPPQYSDLGMRLGSAHHAGSPRYVRTHLGTRLGSAHHHHALPISIDVHEGPDTTRSQSTVPVRLCPLGMTYSLPSRAQGASEMSCMWTGLPAAVDHLGQCGGGLLLPPSVQ